MNVIESFCKSKIRQSVSIQDSVANALNTSNNSSKGSLIPVDNNKKLIEDKSRLETNVETLVSELNENKKSNKELKMVYLKFFVFYLIKLLNLFIYK